MGWRPRRSSLVWSLAAPAAALYAPAPAFAVDYLSADQAQASIFPDAERFEPRELPLEADERRALEKRLGLPVRERWAARVARREGKALGVVLVDDVIGKFERITFAVGIGADGAVRQIEILSYRESHGHEVRLPAWRKQFVGKGPSSALRVGEDVSNISGATLSCRHVTDGVRRIVAVADALRRRGALE
jgi:Na+-translocating ferredoxin:NAD+ oxidoreductase RnfG subunit